MSGSGMRAAARRAQEQGEVLRAAAEVLEKLAEAKRRHGREGSVETRAAKRQAMEETARFRRFMRAMARASELKADLVDPPDGQTAEERAAVERELQEMCALAGVDIDQVPARRRTVERGSTFVRARGTSARTTVSGRRGGR